MARDGGLRRSVIPRLSISRLKRHNDRKSDSPTLGMSNLGKATSQDQKGTILSRVDTSSPSSFATETPQNDTTPTTPETRSEVEVPIVQRSLMSDPIMSPIFLGEDFAALLSVPAISSQESLWVDLWQHFDPGEKVIPVDGQYLTSLKSFVGLRSLRVTGMLKSYQKELFQAIWKMEQLEHLQLRMAEEPRVSSRLPWRPIEEGWFPKVEETHAGISPGDGKGRIKKQYGNAEYLDNCVIELAKPRLKPDHPEYEAWVSRLLPIVHLTLRGFVVDAIPFCSCFDGERFRSITFTDCIDAGFCLPYEMNNIELRVDGSKTAKAEPIRQVVPNKELKRITLKQGKKIDESPASPAQSVSSRSRYHKRQDSSTSIPRYVPVPSPSPASFSSLIPSGQGLRQPRLSLNFRRRVVSSVIEEDEGEE